MCDTDRTRVYLPLLQNGSREDQDDFTAEFFDCAFQNASWKTLDFDERVESVHDGFLNIFAAALAGLLPDLKGSYVHGAVSLQCRNRWLKRKRRPKEVPLEAALADGEINLAKDDAADELGWDELLSAVGLTNEEKQILERRFVYDWALEEIGSLLSVSRNTVVVRLRRALDKIRRYLEDEPGRTSGFPA